MYTELQEAKEILQKRMRMKCEVENSWGNANLDFPFKFDAPTAVVAKPAMFRIESAKAITMAESQDLQTCWLTYDADRFTSASKIKRSLVSPYFTSRRDKHGNFISEKVPLVKNHLRVEKRELQTMVSDNNQPVMDLHRERLKQAHPEVKISDMSSWAKSLGDASSYYEYYLSLFVSHAILFEDYHGGESGKGLSDFTTKIFEPAFEKVTQKFGAKPIIVKLPWEPSYAYHPDGELLDKWREELIPVI
jgi:hypothetical protein